MDRVRFLARMLILGCRSETGSGQMLGQFQQLHGRAGALLQSSGASSALDGTLERTRFAQSVRQLDEAYCKESNRLVRTRLLSWCGRGSGATRTPIPMFCYVMSFHGNNFVRDLDKSNNGKHGCDGP